MSAIARGDGWKQNGTKWNDVEVYELFDMKKIKLIHVISNLERGGAQAVLYNLLCHLSDQKFEHHVIYFRYGPYVQQIKELNISIYHVNGILCLYDPVFFVRFFRLIKQLKPDCMHSLLWAANSVSRLVACWLGIPLVSVIHNNVDQDGYIRYAIDYISLSLSKTYVTVSDGARTSFVKRYPWFEPHYIQVIQNGINVDEVNAHVQAYSISKRELGIAQNDFIIGSVGRFELVKNYALLLKSFSTVVQRVKNVHLMLVGSGSQEIMLRNYAQQLGIAKKVTFIIGQQSYAYLPLFDCFALTSDKEGISIALLEVMALGIVPIVTTMEQQHPVIESGKNGLLVPAGNFQLLATELTTIIFDAQLRQKMGSNARQTIKNEFDYQKMNQAYRLLFSERVDAEKTL